MRKGNCSGEVMEMIVDQLYEIGVFMIMYYSHDVVNMRHSFHTTYVWKKILVCRTRS